MVNYFDIGAHEGKLMVEMNRMIRSTGLTYKMHGFEPNPLLFYNLQQLLKINNIPAEVYSIAFSNYSGKSKLYKSKTTGGDSLHATKNNVTTNVFAEVNVMKFSEWARGTLRPGDFNKVKIDAEGSEFEMYEDIIESGIHKHINMFCGSLGDIYKIGKTESEINKFLKYLADNGVEVMPLSSKKLENLTVIEQAILTFVPGQPEIIPVMANLENDDMMVDTPIPEPVRRRRGRPKKERK
jgi:FkbM family methyltransferase